MKIDHLGFTDAVERLAARVGIQLRYDETPGGRGGARGSPPGSGSAWSTPTPPPRSGTPSS